MCHKYEYKTLEMFFPDDMYFERIGMYILSKSSIIKSPTLNKITDSNRYPFGKLFIHLQGIPGI